MAIKRLNLSGSQFSCLPPCGNDCFKAASNLYKRNCRTIELSVKKSLAKLKAIVCSMGKQHSSFYRKLIHRHLNLGLSLCLKLRCILIAFKAFFR